MKLGGIIGNSRKVAHEEELLREFAETIGTQLIAFIPRETIVHDAEIHRQTVLEYAPQSTQAEVYRRLAKAIETNEKLTIPEPMVFDELEEMVERYGN